jgi:hypothetical protein
MARTTAFAMFVCYMAIGLTPLTRAADEAAGGRLTIPDVCSIDAPGKGWMWKPVKEYEAGKGGAYICSSPAKPGKVILTIDPRKLEKDPQRIAALKADFNTLYQQLQKIGCTDIKGKQPSLTTPIPEDVDYLVLGKTDKGTMVFFAAHTIFKDQTFLVQAVGPSLEQTQKLADVAKTLTQK